MQPGPEVPGNDCILQIASGQHHPGMLWSNAAIDVSCVGLAGINDALLGESDIAVSPGVALFVSGLVDALGSDVEDFLDIDMPATNSAELIAGVAKRLNVEGQQPVAGQLHECRVIATDCER